VLVLKFGPQWKYEKYITVQKEVVFKIIMYLFNYICVYNLLVPTNAYSILIYILYNIYVLFFSFLLISAGHHPWGAYKQMA
jgi:hypothetical protein